MEEEEGGCQKTRDFICSCGKNYLSYAALFTHIKQKHDGKAPGPIVRPRSQRKRGRPRKNPLADQDIHDSDSDAAKNGISIVNEINNNNNLNSLQTKRKQAAELLGCGQFKGFQSYRPEAHQFLKPKSIKQPLSRPGFKRYISNTQKMQPKQMRDQTYSQNELPEKILPSRSATAQEKIKDSAHSSYPFNFVIMHMKTLFQGYTPSQEELSCKQIIQILDWMGQEVSESKEKYVTKYQNISKVTIQNGLKAFISSIQNVLEDFELKQISFFFSLFYEHITQNLGKPLNTMTLGLKFTELTKYISSFVNNYLPLKISQLKIDCLHIFKAHNPVTIMLALCNWISLQQMEQSMKENKIGRKSQPKLQGFRSFSNNHKNMNGKNTEKSQSQQDLKFQQINYVFDQLHQNKECIKTKSKQQLKNVYTNNHKQNDFGNEQNEQNFVEYHQNQNQVQSSESHQNYQQGMQLQCKEKNESKIIIDHQ